MDDHRNRQAVLKELLDNGEVVNGALLTGDGGVFPVHLQLVASRSPYLKRAILAAAVGADPASSRILVPAATKAAVADVVGFMYTGRLEVSFERVQELTEVGELLGMPDVIRFCKEFLESGLNTERCIMVYKFAKRHRYGDLREIAKSYVLKHFQQVFPVSSDYLELREDEVAEMLSSDLLNVHAEENVFWALLRWVERDPLTRAHGALSNLLRCVRFGLCSKEFLDRHVSQNALVCGNEECQSVVLQASQLFEDMPPQMDEVDPRLRLRATPLDPRHPFLRPRTPTEAIFVMGGWSAGAATNVIETFDVNSGRWFLSLHADSIPRAYHGMLWHRGYVYVIGGFDGNQCFSTVRRYDPAAHAWQEVGCMQEQRCYVSVAAVDRHIYAMGGYDGHRRNRSCERFDPDANQWDRVAFMNHVRSDASADALNGKVYVAGGFNGQQVLLSAECYDPSADEWTMIPTMHSPRSGVKLVAYGEHLYVIGGFNGNARLATVDRYDPRTRVWSAVGSMQSPRSNFATAILHDCLYVIGGFNGLATISGVECFHHQRNAWHPVTELNLNRSALAACTIKDLSNMHAYAFLGNAAYA